MKTQDPTRSGLITNRLHGLSQDIATTIESSGGLHKDNVTFEEMKAWFKSRLFNIHLSLEDMKANAHDLIIQESAEVSKSSDD